MKHRAWLLWFGIAFSAYAQGGPRTVSEQYLFQAANAERAERGLPQLRWDSALYGAADAHARQMARRESISHQYPGEPELSARGRMAGARFSTIAENVAMAQTAVRIHDAWMKSPGHRANLLDENVDAIGIRVLERNGELYAVEDFERTVADLSVDDQEAQVDALIALASHGMVTIMDDHRAARATCDTASGYAGDRRPGFVMRFTAGDLTRLPDQLIAKLAEGKFHQVAVGACSVRGKQEFSTFSVAVLLYP